MRTYAIGVSPAIIEFQDILPTNSVSSTFFLSRLDTITEETIHVRVEGGGAEAIELSAQDIVFFENEQEKTFLFTIAPKAYSAGEYEAFFVFSLSNTAESTIVPGLTTTVRFTVSNQTVENFHIQQVTVHDTEEHLPVGFSYTLVNEGNVDTHPERIVFSLRSSFDATKEYSEEISSAVLPVVPAFSSHTADIVTSLTPPAGAYDVSIEFFDEEGQVFSQDTHTQILSTTPLSFWDTFRETIRSFFRNLLRIQ